VGTTLGGGDLPGGSQSGGTSIWKNYELSDDDVAQLYNANGPLSTLTHARTSTSEKGICYDVGIDPVDGMRVRCFGDNRVPYAYDSTLCGLPGNGRMCLAEPVHSAVTNLNTNSEDFTTWAPTNASIAANVAIAPDGTMTADTLTENNAPASLHYMAKSIVVTAAEHTTNVYLKKGGRWGVRIDANSAIHFSHVNLGTCTLGITSGAPVLSIVGVGNGWCKLSMRKLCTAGARGWNVVLASADGVTTFDGDPITYPVGAYIWGESVYLGTATHYCPTDASTQTCNAPTSNFIAASYLASWDELGGVISSMANVNDLTTPGKSWYMKPASTGNFLNGWNEAWWYNSASALQQRIGFTSSTATQPLGAVSMFESGSMFYGTRRSALRTYGSDYAGLTTTYTTDGSANWSPAVGSDLHLGMGNAGGSQINGQLGSVYIWKSR